MHRFPKLRQRYWNSTPPHYTEDFQNWRQNASNQCRLTHGKPKLRTRTLQNTFQSHPQDIIVVRVALLAVAIASNRMLFTDPSNKCCCYPHENPGFNITMLTHATQFWKRTVFSQYHYKQPLSLQSLRLHLSSFLFLLNVLLVFRGF